MITANVKIKKGGLYRNCTIFNENTQGMITKEQIQNLFRRKSILISILPEGHSHFKLISTDDIEDYTIN